MDNRILRLGDSGEAVLELSRILKALHYPVSAPDVFNQRMLASVKAFQNDKRLTIDGVVGPQTWSALYDASTAKDGGALPKTIPLPETISMPKITPMTEIVPMSEIGSIPEAEPLPEMDEMQENLPKPLVENIPEMSSERLSGNVPEMSSERFEENVPESHSEMLVENVPNIPPNQLVWDMPMMTMSPQEMPIDSREMLVEAPEVDSYTDLRLGASGDDVIFLQQALTELGYFHDEIDGIFGPKTAKAVSEFQGMNGLKVDEIVGPRTWGALLVALNLPDNAENMANERAAINENQKDFVTKASGAMFARPMSNAENRFAEPLNSFPPPPGTFANISLGSTGDDVTKLQKYLTQLGFFNGIADGIFNKRTEGAVMSFQASNGLDADGVVGPRAWEAITQGVNEVVMTGTVPTSGAMSGTFLGASKHSGELEPTPERILSLGSVNDDVKLVQQILSDLGFYQFAVDGVFGPKTTSAVQSFQEARGLKADGVVGPKTWDALMMEPDGREPSQPEVHTVLEIGSSGNDVSQVQAALTVLMYYNGEITGNYDEATMAAVRRFQENNGLMADGKVNEVTWQKLLSLFPPSMVYPG